VFCLLFSVFALVQTSLISSVIETFSCNEIKKKRKMLPQHEDYQSGSAGLVPCL
jgi:hypothetical protein